MQKIVTAKKKQLPPTKKTAATVVRKNGKQQPVKTSIVASKKQASTPQELTDEMNVVVKKIIKLQEEAGILGADLVRVRFDQSLQIRVVRENKRYGSDAMEDLAKRVGMHPSYLYKLYDLGKRYNFNVDRLEEDITKTLEAGQEVQITKFLKSGEINRDPKRVGGEKNHIDELAHTMERGAEAAEVMQEKYADDPEAQGAIENFNESMHDTARALTDPIKKKVRAGTKAFRDEDHRKFVNEHEVCCVTGEKNPDRSHILPRGAAGSYSSDLVSCGMSRKIHDIWEKLPAKDKQGRSKWEQFEAKYGVNVFLASLQTTERYVTFLKERIKKLEAKK